MASRSGLVAIFPAIDRIRDEQTDEPKRRIGRFLKSTFFGRRWVIGGVLCE
jgi:hypothetical protein